MRSSGAHELVPYLRPFRPAELATIGLWHHVRGAMTETAATLTKPSVAARALMALVRFYQLAISPWLGRACRFEPSCSRYAMASLETHGALRGSLLSLVRLSKCHPFHPGGFDPPVGRVVGRPHGLEASPSTQSPERTSTDPRPADR